ncbi:MAG: hypothetical protein JO283_01970, partial [Bradyrhizobium sp.]|nr:hypothetical protein [Bradyrhizobium sp.]
IQGWDRVALPVHQLPRLTDDSALGHAALALDPADDLVAEGEPLNPIT